MKEERTYMRKVGSLKALFEKRIQELTKEVEPREARSKREEEVKQLQTHMDQNFEEASSTFERAKVARDMDLYWKTWSKAVEDAYIKWLDLGSKEAEKAFRGRGKVTLVKRGPKNARKTEETIRNEWAYEAHRSLKQARRAEQMLYRSEAMGSTEKEKKHKYEDLNKQAARLIIQNAKNGEQWEKDLSMRMQHVMAKGKVDTMESPAIQRAIGKYHDSGQTNKKKAMAEHERARAKIFQAKDRGQWDLYKQMKEDAANPIIAVRRSTKGP